MTAVKLLLTLAVLAGGFAVALCVALGFQSDDGPTPSYNPPLPDCTSLGKRLEAKERIIARLVEGRLTLFEAAQKLQFVGSSMQDRDQWLERVLRRLAELKTEAEKRAVTT